MSDLHVRIDFGDEERKQVISVNIIPELCAEFANKLDDILLNMDEGAGPVEIEFSWGCGKEHEDYMVHKQVVACRPDKVNAYLSDVNAFVAEWREQFAA